MFTALQSVKNPTSISASPVVFGKAPQRPASVLQGPAADTVEIRFGEGGAALSQIFDALAKRAQYTHAHGRDTQIRDETRGQFIRAVGQADAKVLSRFYAEKIQPMRDPNSTLPRISTTVLAAIAERAVKLEINLEEEAERYTLQKTIATSLGKLDLPGRPGEYFEAASVHELRTEAQRLKEVARLREEILEWQIDQELPLDEDLQRSTDLVRLKVALAGLENDLPVQANERPAQSSDRPPTPDSSASKNPLL